MEANYSNNYNREYYIKNYGQSGYLKNKGYFLSVHSLIYQEIANLAEIQPGDEVVDYGCGNGDLAFYLVSKFHCKVKAIDYSKEAIDICDEKLKQTGGFNVQIKFINSSSKHLPDFENIKIVFFCDVFEHMCDEEIGFVLEQVKKWNINDKVKIVIHTDNNNYLKFINPLFNLLKIFLRKESISQIKKESKIERELHVNLTTPKKLKNKMEKWGYRQITLEYPSPVKTRIEKQLGKLQNIPYLYKTCVFMLRKFIFLTPSFYAVYESNS